MKELIFLYVGTIFFMFLSQVKYRVDVREGGSQTGGRHFIKRKMDIFMLVVIFWLSAFSFLRYSYNDTYTYIISFWRAETVASGFSRGTFTDWTGNPLSMLYRSLIRDLTTNYHIYFLFPAVMSSYAVIKLIKRYSVNPAFSLLFFLSIGTYILYIAALKQCLAVFFLLMALPYAIEKKYGKFYLLVLVAVMFHTHAFMFAIVPFLMEKPWGKVTWLFLGATLFALATYNTTFGVLMAAAQSIGVSVAAEELFDNHQINVLRVLVYWVPALLSAIFRRRLFTNSTRTENLFVNMSLISAFILTIGLAQGANLYARMAGYFEIATAIALPWMLKKLFTKESAKSMTVIAGALYFGYFLYEFGVSKNFENDYQAITFWQFIQGLLP